MISVATGMHDSHSSPRWLMPVLVGSLALNLIVIGAAGSLIWRSHLGGNEAMSGRVIPSVLGYAATLPPERISALEEQTKEERQKVRPVRRALVEAREEWAKVLSAEPFDRQRLLAAQARLVEVDEKSRDAAFKLHLAIGIHLTPEERRGFARWREQQRQGRPPNPLDELTKPGEPPR
jgi:uncharacterized membrane protein